MNIRRSFFESGGKTRQHHWLLWKKECFNKKINCFWWFRTSSKSYTFYFHGKFPFTYLLLDLTYFFYLNSRRLKNFNHSSLQSSKLKITIDLLDSIYATSITVTFVIVAVQRGWLAVKSDNYRYLFKWEAWVFGEVGTSGLELITVRKLATSAFNCPHKIPF